MWPNSKCSAARTVYASAVLSAAEAARFYEVAASRRRAAGCPPRRRPKPKLRPPNPSPELIYAKSPIVGTFYEAASPDTPPFVRIGEHVTPGKVLCIIESMKLMNEIEADIAGIIESKLVQNGQAVEYGEALFGIRPV